MRIIGEYMYEGNGWIHMRVIGMSTYEDIIGGSLDLLNMDRKLLEEEGGVSATCLQLAGLSSVAITVSSLLALPLLLIRLTLRINFFCTSLGEPLPS